VSSCLDIYSYNIDRLGVYVQKLAQGWSLSYTPLLALPASQRLLVKYEDLIVPSKREVVLSEMVAWLLGSASAERVQCAFQHADHRATHRTKSADSMTAELAFDRGLACDVWAVLGSLVDHHGYMPINDFNCG
jgi:hypothetical protein